MFCSRCGKRMEEGSVFCSGCGSHLGAANMETESTMQIIEDGKQGAQDQSEHMYTPGNIPPEDHGGIKLDNTAIWIMALLPVIGIIATLVLIPVSIPLAILVCLLIVAGDAALYVMDKRQFDDGALSGWGWTAIVVPVVYLYMRAAKFDKKYAPAVTHSVILVINSMVIIMYSMFMVSRYLFEHVQMW
ncbi:MAG: zinc ribbon domain-containing protein [Clostridia bacterium]